ncbi:hypothetical protein NL676_001883 [Syzygium grande]|nr:hypothetical protein NL676_001883 [Syzygium grande]
MQETLPDPGLGPARLLREPPQRPVAGRSTGRGSPNVGRAHLCVARRGSAFKPGEGWTADNQRAPTEQESGRGGWLRSYPNSGGERRRKRDRSRQVRASLAYKPGSSGPTRAQTRCKPGQNSD